MCSNATSQAKDELVCFTDSFNSTVASFSSQLSLFKSALHNSGTS